MKKVLIEASKIIFINPNIEKSLTNQISDKNLLKIIKEKSEVIPNGIDQFWLNNCFYRTQNIDDKIRLIHVGRLIKRKNQIKTLLVASELIKRGYEVDVNIIGSGKDYDKLYSLVRELNIESVVKFHGFIKDKNQLKSLYRKSDIFILPSYSETFGIAYIEAMSQGLPVIYSQNQGIDGYYKDMEVGHSVNPESVGEICNAILKIKANYTTISENCTRSSLQYNWTTIASRYIDIYSNSINNELK